MKRWTCLYKGRQDNGGMLMLIWDHGCYERIAFHGVHHLLARQTDEIGYWTSRGGIQVVQAVRTSSIEQCSLPGLHTGENDRGFEALPAYRSNAHMITVSGFLFTVLIIHPFPFPLAPPL